MSSKGVIIGILIALLVIIIIYVILMFEFYRQHKFIFSPYIPPNPPSEFHPFNPLGKVTPMSQEEIDQRNKLYADYIARQKTAV